MDPPNKTKFVGQPFFFNRKKITSPHFFLPSKKKNILDRQKIRTQENLKKKVHGNGDTIHIC